MNTLLKISFGRDFEQQLSFYVEARATFTNLDQVMVFLVHVSVSHDCHVDRDSW